MAAYEGSYLDYHDQCLAYLLFGDSVARIARVTFLLRASAGPYYAATRRSFAA